MEVLSEGFSCVQGSLHHANGDILPCHPIASPHADWVITVPDDLAHVVESCLHQHCVLLWLAAVPHYAM
jgi:hypothetical protein